MEKNVNTGGSSKKRKLYPLQPNQTLLTKFFGSSTNPQIPDYEANDEDEVVRHRRNKLLIVEDEEEVLVELSSMADEDEIVRHRPNKRLIVEDEEDVNDLNQRQCKVKKEQAEFLHEVSDIFWEKYVSNDRNPMEAVLEQLTTLWGKPRYYVFVCAGNFVQVG